MPDENENIMSDAAVAMDLTAHIVGAYVANNSLSASALPELIRSVHSALSGLRVAPATEPVATQLPAVPVRKSVHPDYIVCLEDGKKLKMLKRHLMTAYGMTPDQYRAKWKLPDSYPMVAPNYASQRSTLAKAIGLGRRRSEPVAPPTAEAPKPARRRRMAATAA
ncbi:MAG TPA: MucR family transcriptional regulator [Stellaceae bacterium]|nr:MucR family transcriptional regulator [Stellaceae bacterium]